MFSASAEIIGDRLPDSHKKESTPLYPAVSPGPAGKLRVGVMLDNFEGEAWVGKIFKDIQASEFAEIAGVVINWEPILRKDSWLRNLAKGRIFGSAELFWRYCLVDRKFHQDSASPFRSVDFRDLLPDVPVIDATPIRKKYVHRFDLDTVEAVRELDLDVILRFGFNVLKGDILDAARHGIWSYHHGDNRSYRGGPAMFWEIYDDNPVCGTILQRLTDSLDTGHVLYRSYAKRRNTAWLTSVRHRPFWKATAFVERSLRALCQNGRSLPTVADDKTQGKLYRAPSNVEMLSFAARASMRAVTGNIKAAVRESQWFLAYRTNADAFIKNTLKTDYDDFRPIYPPKGANYADPFLFEHEGFDYCFFEATDARNSKGKINCLRFDEAGNASVIKTVLEMDSHLSYPFVFEWEGEIYMMPEAAATNGVQLFRASRFPHRWEHCAELITGYPAYDPTLFRHGDKWFLFVNVDECGGGSDDELFLFVADSLFGPWQPHPKNPVKSDARSARSAGKLFRHEGRLIRPAQDCSNVYGGAIQLCEVTELSETDYSEHVVATVAPTWCNGLSGCHTLNATNRTEIMDGRRVTWRRPRLSFGK